MRLHKDTFAITYAVHFFVGQLCFWPSFQTIILQLFVDFSFFTWQTEKKTDLEQITVKSSNIFFQSTGKWKPSGSKKECGKRISLSNIVGGKITKNGDFPYMALLGKTASDGKNLWSCGGSLINKWYVLTAAHCIRSKTGNDNPPE